MRIKCNCVYTFRMANSLVHTLPVYVQCVFVCRSGGDWGGRADGAAAEPAEPSAGQSLFRPRAACPKGQTVIWWRITHSWFTCYTQSTNITYFNQWNVCLGPRLLSSITQISRVIQLRPDGRLEQTVSMATDNQPLMQHLHITYRRQAAFT